MRIYRVEYLAYGGESQGFTFHETEASANAAISSHMKNDDSAPSCAKEHRDVDLTRGGVLSILREWAAHPDNG